MKAIEARIRLLERYLERVGETEVVTLQDFRGEAIHLFGHDVAPVIKAVTEAWRSELENQKRAERVAVS